MKATVPSLTLAALVTWVSPVRAKPSAPAPVPLPSATIQGRTVHLAPSGATFEVPQGWLEWHGQFRNNLHLTRAELEAVKTAAKGGDWDPVYADVANAALPFSACAAHVGGEGWSDQSVSYGDVQARAYVLQGDPRHWLARAASAGMRAAAEPLFQPHPKMRYWKSAPTLERGVDGPWSRATVRYRIKYGDYGAPANVDFYARAFGGQTVALVFMYTDFPDKQKEEIRGILNSFAWKQ